MILLKDLSGILTPFFWEISIQISILFFVILIISQFSRRSSPLFHYWLWCIGLFRLCIPFTISVSSNENSVFIDYSLIELPVIDSTSQSSIAFSFSLNEYITLLWLSVVGLLCAAYLGKLLLTYFALSSSPPVKRSVLTKRFEQLKNELGLSNSTELKYLDMRNAQSPAAAGLLHPTVYLPRQIADTWPVKKVEPILMHELIHIKRSDLIVNFVQIIIQIIFFFHPLVWIMNRKIRQYREDICDSLAQTGLQLSRKEYADCILQVSEDITRESHLGFAGIGFFERKHSLTKRIHTIMKCVGKESIAMTYYTKITVAFVTGLCIYFACEREQETMLSSSQQLSDNESTSEQSLIVTETIPELELLPIENQLRIIEGSNTRGSNTILSAIADRIVYPQKAKEEGKEGLVLVRTLVGEDGSVLETKIAQSSGYSELDNAAIEAIKSVSFSPATQDSDPVKFWTSLPIRFKL